MLYFWVSVAYSLVNPLLAVLILVRSRRNVLSQFYAFCVTALTILGMCGYMCTRPDPPLPAGLLMAACAFLYSVFPFFFLHFMLIFVRRYEILRSRHTIMAVYFAGIFSYTMVLLGFVPIPFSPEVGITPTGYIYYLTWMSILFSIGVALLYSLVGGFGEHGIKSNLLSIAFLLLMLLLPTPFTLSIFSIVAEDAQVWFFLSSTAGLTVLVYIVFRHRITMNTPYQAMKAALSAMNDILFKTSGDFTIELAQGGVGTLLGYTDQEMHGLSLLSFLRNPEQLVRYRSEVLADRLHECAFESEILRKNGTALPMEFTFTPVLVNEEVTGFVGVGRDIAERRQAERIRECTYRIAAVSESSPGRAAFFRELPAVIATLIPTRNVLVALREGNAAALSYPCFQDERALPPPAGLPTELAGVVLSSSQPLLLSPQSAETMVAAGILGERPEYSCWLGVPLISGGEAIGVLAVGDYQSGEAFTERDRDALVQISAQVVQSIAKKKSDDALRASEESYRLFFENDLTGDFIATPEGHILDCNPAFVSIFGFASREEACTATLDAIYPESARRTETVGLVRTRGKLVSYEEILRKQDGSTLHVVQNLVGVFDAAGRLTHVRGYVFDATERHNLEEQLRQAQKLENLGAMAGGIAHDFNNLLTIMSVHLAMLKPEDHRPPHAAGSLDAMGNAVRRGAGLVSQLLTFARKAEVQVAPVNVSDAIREVERMLSAALPKTIELRLLLDPARPVIPADANQLHQVLLNLCLNARDAMPAGGTLTIATSLEDGVRLRSTYRDARPEPYVVIRVSDTGSGMDEATRRKIFEPFFTTKDKGKGTGLGLAVVYGVVRSHRGFIHVDSTPGVGSTFTLYFPSPVCSAAASERGVSRGHRPAGETLLYVEDELPVREAMAHVMQEAGYRVYTADDGRNAVTLFQEHRDEIDLVVTDIGLPGQNGWEAYRQMTALQPGLRAVFVTGYLAPELREEMEKTGPFRCVQKPYTPASLLGAIQDALSVVPAGG